MSAAQTAAQLFGPQLRRFTLATVLDVDTATPHDTNVLHPQPWPEEVAARETLASARLALRDVVAVPAGTVILAGEPAGALVQHARDGAYEVIVVGCRGKGLSKLLLGSCASTLARATTTPVLLIPPAASSPVSGPAMSVTADG